MIQTPIFDWARAWRYGNEIAGDYVRSGSAITDEAIMWALLCEAARVSRTFPSPPWQGYPSKSAMPDSPDEITHWQRMASYIRGEMDELPETDSKPPLPSAEEITRAEAVLAVWHHAVTLGRDRKRAVYIAACGAKPRRITRVTGLSSQDMKNAKRRALGEMLGWIARAGL